MFAANTVLQRHDQQDAEMAGMQENSTPAGTPIGSPRIWAF